jgi:uncharacterized lipoprotein YbaY
MALPLRRLAWAVATVLAATTATGCGPRGSGPDEIAATAKISGVLLTAPGQSMPEGVPLELELAELSSAKQAPAAIATAKLESAAGAETPFTVEYDPTKTSAGHTYVLRARAVIQGTTYLAGNAVAAVAAQAPAFPLDIVLRRPPNASPLYLDVSVLRLEYKGESDWSSSLRDVMPGMLACLRSVSGEGISVSKAWAMSGGRIGVRVRNADGSGFECVALADGSKFESLSGLPSFAEALPGEGNPSFVPAPASPRIGECRRYERVLGGVNETLGWLVYDTCAEPAAVAPGAPAAAPST